jgi:hypothetical protein
MRPSAGTEETPTRTSQHSLPNMSILFFDGSYIDILWRREVEPFNFRVES